MKNKINKVAVMIEEFQKTSKIQRLEQLADNLAETEDRQAINPLLIKLGDSQVQDDPDVEDAFCSALVKFGVMRKLIQTH